MIVHRTLALAFVAAILAPANAALSAPTPATRVTTGLEGAFYIAGRPRRPQALADRMRYYRVPAVSIAVIDGYRVVWVYAAGFRDVAAKARATPRRSFKPRR